MMRMNPISQEDIRVVFYNGLVEQLTNGSDFDFTRANLPEKIKTSIAILLQSIILNSSECNGLRLPGINTVLNQDNCPNLYLPMLSILMGLKDQPSLPTLKQLGFVAAKMMALPSFKQMDPTEQLLVMAGVEVEPVIAQRHYSEDNITPALIQETFYNEMLTQTIDAISNQWMSLDDVIDQESHVFFACPALTLLQAMQESMTCDGIRLLDNKMVTLQSCPQTEGYPELVTLLLKMKELVGVLSPSDLLLVRQLLASEELPVDLEARRTEATNKAFAAIKGMAITISQRKTFNPMVTKVFARCTEILSPASPPRSPKF